MKSIQLSSEQEMAYDAIAKFASEPLRRVFYLAGLAGTGKTTLLARVANELLPKAPVLAPTGKAASVLRDKMGRPAHTIHSHFLRLRDKQTDKRGRRILGFDDIYEEDELRGKIVLLDECSMVDCKLAESILKPGVRLIACGDPGQLPPVSGQQFFTKPDFTLTQIHRQAQESAIIRQAHSVRAGLEYAPDGPDFRVAHDVVSDEDIRAADVILTFTNRARDAANAEARRLRGFWQSTPQAGEPVVCLRNAPEYGIFNGAVYRLLAPIIPGETTVRLDVDGTPTAIPWCVFRGVPCEIPDDIEPTTFFDYGYSLTVHKSQGSEWPSIVLLDECRRGDLRTPFLYTGITRASDRCVVIAPGGMRR